MGDILFIIVVLAFFVLLSRFVKSSSQKHEHFGASCPGVIEGNPFFCLSLRNEVIARELCKKLEVMTAGYMNYPLRLDVTEIAKFCEMLIYMKALFGVGRNEKIRDLLSCFSEIDSFFCHCGHPLCNERFRREWLLKECESMFSSRHKEVLDDIRERIKIVDDSVDGSNSGVEIYRQRCLPHQICGGGLETGGFGHKFDFGYFEGENTCADTCNRGFQIWRANIFQVLREEALKIYLKCLRDILTCTCLPLIRNSSETPKNQPEVRYYPEAEKPKVIPKRTASNPYLSAPYLLDKLNKGAKINLSYGLVFETVKYSGRNCVEMHGLEGKYRNGVLDCGGKSVKIDGREHILIATDNVLAVDYLLVFHKVLNVYDASIRELEPENATPTTHQELPSEPPNPSAPPDKPAELTATALALIGRPTLHNNEYLTPSMTQSRHEAERPFVKILSATYRTDTERKAMSRYFMLWKEFAVFVALSQVLKSDKSLLAQTQSKLKECLNEGLPPDVLRKRVERMRAMSGTFTAEYKISGSLEQSFLRTFRETLPDGLPELPYSESIGGYLVGIYRFICAGLKRRFSEIEHGGS